MSDLLKGLLAHDRLVMFAQPVGEGDGFQRIFPAGTFHTNKYGKLNIDKTMIQAMAKHFADRVLGEREPFIDTDHDFAGANGWIKGLEARDDGLYAKIEWTDKGKRLLESKEYKYVSAAIGEHKELTTGKRYYPVLLAASLTNTPVMNNLKELHLSERGSAHSDGEQFSGGFAMNIDELLKAISEMEITEEEKKKILEALGIKIPEKPDGEPGGNPDTQASDKKVQLLSETIQSQSETIKQLSDKLAGFEASQKAEKKEKLLSDAITKGLILPKDKDEWSKKVDKFGQDAVAEMFSLMKPVVSFGAVGTNNGGEAEEFSDEDRQAAELAGMSREEYLELKKQGAI